MSLSPDTSALQHLDDPARQQVLSFIQAESAKAKIQTSVTQFTNMCFRKCVNDEKSLSTEEESCMSDCLNRFLDTNIKVVKILQSMQK